MGLTTRLPLQFGHKPPRTSSAQVAQNVHSNVQMRASVLEGGRSRSQHSQLGLISNMRSSVPPVFTCPFNGGLSKGARTATLALRSPPVSPKTPSEEVAFRQSGRPFDHAGMANVVVLNSNKDKSRSAGSRPSAVHIRVPAAHSG